VHAITPHFLDVTAPDFDPGGSEVAAARTACWWAETPLGPAFVRYDDVVALLRDRRFGQGSAVHLDVQGIGDGPLRRWWRELILNLEGPRHDRLRRLMVPAFRPAVVDGLRPRMRRAIDEVVATVLAGQGAEVQCDAVAMIADPYPITVLAELLDVPADERPLVRRWANDVGLAFSFRVAEFLERIETAVVGLHEIADRLIVERRRRPGTDLVSQLVSAEEEGERLTAAELRNMVVATLFAGHDTTKHQLALALHTVTGQPGSWDLLAARPDLAAGVVEEVMRTAPAVPIILRLALEDVDYRGLRIPAGSLVLAVVAAANTDPEVHGDAGFSMTPHGRRQLTFGGGAHHCIGHLLARAELAEALPRLAAAWRDVRIAGPVEWRPSTGIAGPTALPIAFRRR
jgi:cytochrome P450